MVYLEMRETLAWPMRVREASWLVVVSSIDDHVQSSDEGEVVMYF